MDKMVQEVNLERLLQHVQDAAGFCDSLLGMVSNPRMARYLIEMGGESRIPTKAPLAAKYRRAVTAQLLRVVAARYEG